MMKVIVKKYGLVLFLFTGLTTSYAQKNKSSIPLQEQYKNEALASISSASNDYKEIAMRIWEYAELGYKEVKSSSLLQETLKKGGFSVESGVAGIPTAFVATYGSGKPVIGILAEFDALPGLSQEATPERKSIPGLTAGHGCGHHLFGTASVASGIAIKQLMEQKKISGTIKIFGCPAEEGGSGKVYMVRAGLFKDVDAAIHWHPDSENYTTTKSALANISGKFRFYGVSSHASDAPDRGRSALDAVESMNFMVNLLREHVPQETRIHYVITSGGKAPNVVPDFAEVYYYVRHPKREQVKQIFERVVKAAQAGAIGSETKMEYEIIGGTHDLLINKTLAGAMQKNLEKVGGITYDDNETAFATKIQSTFNFKYPAVDAAKNISPLRLDVGSGGGSTDVGDVSYVLPTVGMRAATWAPGTPMHSWQAVACGGTSIATKGMIVAAKSMALTAIDLFIDKRLLELSKKEFIETRGEYIYEALLGNRKPALNYRD